MLRPPSASRRSRRGARNEAPWRKMRKLPCFLFTFYAAPRLSSLYSNFISLFCLARLGRLNRATARYIHHCLQWLNPGQPRSRLTPAAPPELPLQDSSSTLIARRRPSPLRGVQPHPSFRHRALSLTQFGFLRVLKKTQIQTAPRARPRARPRPCRNLGSPPSLRLLAICNSSSRSKSSSSSNNHYNSYKCRNKVLSS